MSLTKRSVVTLEFPAPGLKESTAAAAEDGCQDGHKYTVRSRGQGGETVTAYCRGGPLTKLSLQGKTWLDLEVPRGEELDKAVFRALAAPKRE